MSVATRSAPATDLALLAEIEQFLYREAWLLDTHRFTDWLALYAQDAIYWIPLEHNQKDALETSSILHDDRTLLEIRVKQYTHPRAHARLPLTRTCHQVSNVQILESSAAELRIASTLMLIEYRQERQRTWGALVEHRLRRTQEGLLIAAKRIDLVNSEAELDGIPFLI